jgi:hypothetical protein
MTATATTTTTTTATTTMTTTKRPSRVSRGWTWLVQATSTREPGTSLAQFRIGVAAALLVLVLPLLWTAEGPLVVRFAFTERAAAVGAGGYRDLSTTSLMDLLGPATPSVQHGVLVVLAVAAVLMLVGWCGRVPVLVAAVGAKLAFGQNFDVSGAGDALLGNALFLLLLADCTATWSLDCRLRTGRFVDDTPVPAWPRRLAVLHLAVMYTSTGLQKLVSTAWSPLDGFSALFGILQSPQWARFPLLIVTYGSWLVLPLALLTALTTAWEVSFFVVLWKRRWRALYALVGLALHAGIFALLEVGVFSLLSVAFYPTLFARRSSTLSSSTDVTRGQPATAAV